MYKSKLFCGGINKRGMWTKNNLACRCIIRIKELGPEHTGHFV